MLSEAKNQAPPEGAEPSQDYFHLLEKAWHRFYPGKENPYNALSCYEKLAAQVAAPASKVKKHIKGKYHD